MKYVKYLGLALVLMFSINASALAEDDIFVFIKNGEISSLESAIDKDKSLLSKKNSLGQTPLVYSIYSGDRFTTESLIKKGADVNLKDVNGAGPLHHAVKALEIKKADILIDNKANVNLEDKMGRTPLFYLPTNGESLSSFKEVVMKIESTNMINQLIDGGAKLDYKDKDGNAFLHVLAMDTPNTIDIQGLLISKGADMQIKDAKGVRPYHIAIDSLNTKFKSGLIDKEEYQEFVKVINEDYDDLDAKEDYHASPVKAYIVDFDNIGSVDDGMVAEEKLPWYKRFVNWIKSFFN